VGGGGEKEGGVIEGTGDEDEGQGEDGERGENVGGGRGGGRRRRRKEGKRVAERSYVAGWMRDRGGVDGWSDSWGEVTE